MVINCVHPSKLSDKQLRSEYRYLPVVFSVARICHPYPEKYSKDRRFFYNKLSYLYERQLAIIYELKRRGFSPRYDIKNLQKLNKHHTLWNNWTPSVKDIKFNKLYLMEKSTHVTRRIKN